MNRNTVGPFTIDSFPSPLAVRTPRIPVMRDRHFWLGAAAAACFALFALLLTGCGQGGYAGSGITSLSRSSATIDAGQSIAITATTTGSPNISWSVTGAGCTAAGCGALAGSGGSATYTAPQGVTTSLQTIVSAAITGTSNVRTVNVRVNPAPVITANLPNGTVGAAYAGSLTLSGGTAPLSALSITGNLPAGLTFNAATGAITGTPTTSGTFSVTAKSTDSSDVPYTVTLTQSITISPVPLSITLTSLIDGTVNIPYLATIAVNGGTAPYACTLLSGNLPAGLTLNAGCIVSGLPTIATTATLNLKVTDASNPQLSITAPVSLTIKPAPPTLAISLASVVTGNVGKPLSVTANVTGGTAPYICTVANGTLPAGLSLNGCTISGTPPVTAVSLLTLKATDASQPTQSATALTTITILPGVPTLVLSTPPIGTVGLPFVGGITVSGGTGPYTCSIVSGSLGIGLTLGPDCLIVGIPTTPGSITFTVKATDSSQPQGSITGTVVLTINGPTTTLTLGNPPQAQLNTAYTATIPVTGGTAPYTCAANSALPAGLTLGANCQLAGTPTAAGSTPVNITVTDAATPHATVTANIVITVGNIATLTLTGSLPNATLGAHYDQTLAATGGVAPYTYAVTQGTLPAGLSLSSTGILSGSPTTVGASSFTVTATDSQGTPQTATLPLILLVTYPATANDAALKGPYAFLFQGYDDALLGVLAYHTATAGSFTADGAGILSSGELDSNHQTSTATGNTLAAANFLGTYTIGPDFRGSLTITVLNPDGATGATSTYALSLKAPVAPATVSTRATFLQADNDQLQGTKGNGLLLAQTASDLSAGLSGSYAFGFSGDTPCLPSCSLGIVAGPAAAVGAFTVADGALTGATDINIAATNFPNAALTGAYNTPDANGRVTLTLAAANLPSAYPKDFAVYVVDTHTAFVVSTDKHSAYILLAGTLEQQTQATFSNASMTGAFLGYENSPTNPGLVGATLQNVLGLSTASIFRATANGAGVCNTTNVDTGGLTGLVNNLTGLGSGSNILNALLGTYQSTGASACTVSASGRGTLSYPQPSGLLATTLTLLGLGNNPPAPRTFYLVSPNRGYFLETGYAGLGRFEAQTAIPASLATLNGQFAFASAPAGSIASITATGVLTLDGAGHATSTSDLNVGAGTTNILQLGVNGSFNYTLSNATTGRFTYGSNIIYAIAPGRFVTLDTDPLTTSPSINLLD